MLTCKCGCEYSEFAKGSGRFQYDIENHIELCPRCSMIVKNVVDAIGSKSSEEEIGEDEK